MTTLRPKPEFDVAIVGSGIVGLATAFEISARRPDLRMIVLEKERGPAQHQSGRNSGVVHSGLYYRPGSHKAAMVEQGRRRLFEFCDARGIPYEVCGKVVVATQPSQSEALDSLAARGAANGLTIERLSGADLQRYEPHVAGVAGLHVPAAGIIDYGAVAAALAGELTDSGHVLRFAAPVEVIDTLPDRVLLSGEWGSHSARRFVNCAGLQSDRVARLAGVATGGVRIMPFRGEFFELSPRAAGLVQNLIYPVPDPAFPFLGVHLTRMIGGGVHAGPNAVPALSREGYRRRDVSGRDLREIVGSPGTWALARSHWRTGLAEIGRSLSRRAFLASLRELLPDLSLGDLRPAPAGVRAQAIGPDGTLLDDFVISTSGRGVHVVNAPSPAATAAFEIGAHVAGLALAQSD